MKNGLTAEKAMQIEIVSGSLASGNCVLKIASVSKNLKFFTAGRAMATDMPIKDFGKDITGYNFLGFFSGQNAALLYHKPPLADFARYTVKKNIISVQSSDPINLIFSERGITDLLQKAGESARIKKLTPPICGWNSWDAFNAGVYRDGVIEVMDFARKNKILRENMEYIIIDDGWMTNWGEWSANGKFPGGMKALAGDIKKSGFKPGLWLAPLCAEPVSPLYQYSPECFLKDSKKHPYLGAQGMTRIFYMLDVSVKKTRTFLKDTFARVREWGYEYVKLDFLFNQAECLENPDCSADIKSWSTNQHIKEMLKIARQELGDSTYILGCNYPFELGGNPVNEARFTGDIATFRDNTERNYFALACKYFMLQKWFAGDPDFTIVRVPKATWRSGKFPFHVEVPWKRNEEESGWRKGAFWNEEEMKMNLAAVILSGGSVILGDYLPQVNSRGLDYINKAFYYGRGESAYPLDLGAGKMLPCIWRNNRLLAFFNPFNQPITLPVPQDIKTGKEIFLNSPLKMQNIKLAPFSCRVYEILGNCRY
ncbi:MAG: hypothetical protein A2096_16630 [Spirochaetes bacterium GWF1_41_5]|nr:MAG: hypothetical protein A2096_16630 [Spirochaetes bacterium GWF1_41_5]